MQAYLIEYFFLHFQIALLHWSDKKLFQTGRLFFNILFSTRAGTKCQNNVHLTSITANWRWMNVETTLCASWDPCLNDIVACISSQRGFYDCVIHTSGDGKFTSRQWLAKHVFQWVVWVHTGNSLHCIYQV